MFRVFDILIFHHHTKKAKHFHSGEMSQIQYKQENQEFILWDQAASINYGWMVSLGTKPHVPLFAGKICKILDSSY